MHFTGYYVQVRDDYRDLFMPESFYEKKTFGGDISEGKFRLPAVHAVSVMKSQEVYGKQRFIIFACEQDVYFFSQTFS